MPPGEETRPLGLSPDEWAFCDAQPGGAAAFLRSLVAQARHSARPDFQSLVDVMARLRDPQGGCPGTWSRRR